MGAAIVYTLVRHSTEFFSHEYSYKAALPFFTDHNIYAVIVAFFVPTAIIYSLKSRTLKVSVIKTLFFYGLSFIYLVGVVASYTRAAWVSLGVALAMYAALLLKLKLRHLLGALFLVVGIIAFSWNDIMIYMSKNKVESDSDLDAHVQSIYNVTTDDSNTERLNRWTAAVRMFEEKPVFGFGPNTYQFKYAPYQLSKTKTEISTNLGDLGNAHSEFIGPLAEQGIIGALLVVALMLAAIHIGMQLFYKGKTDRIKYLGLMVLLSFMTYYSHGLLNNYLDIDKANVMFWGAMAIITALSIHQKKLEVKPTATSEQ
jgi:O-antigen ligase